MIQRALDAPLATLEIPVIDTGKKTTGTGVKLSGTILKKFMVLMVQLDLNCEHETPQFVFVSVETRE